MLLPCIYELNDAYYYECCCFNSVDELYIYYCCLWISPLLLENVALRMGNLQVAKTSRSGGSCVLGLWYVTEWELVVVFSFLYVSNFEACCWSFILKINVEYFLCWGLCARFTWYGCNVLKRYFRCNIMLLTLLNK